MLLSRLCYVRHDIQTLQTLWFFLFSFHKCINFYSLCIFRFCFNSDFFFVRLINSLVRPGTHSCKLSELIDTVIGMRAMWLCAVKWRLICIFGRMASGVWSLFFLFLLIAASCNTNIRPWLWNLCNTFYAQHMLCLCVLGPFLQILSSVGEV